MLFNKKIEPSCMYCRFGHDIGKDQIMCEKKGIMDSMSACRRFKYDPLKRTPELRVHISSSNLTEDDFKLD